MHTINTKCKICKAKFIIPIIYEKKDLKKPILVYRFIRCENCLSSIKYEYWMEEKDYDRRRGGI